MSLDILRPFLVDFQEAVTGLRTAQIGRANSHLARLLTHLSRLIARLPPQIQQSAMPMINAMLGAKERNDAIELADLLQYALPAILADTEIHPALLDPVIIGHLRSIDDQIGHDREIGATVQLLKEFQRGHPKTRGLGGYFAARLYDEKRYTDARHFLQIDSASDRQTPADAYLLALVEAKLGCFADSIPLIESAYAKCPTLRDGFAKVGWIKAEKKDWQGAFELAVRDYAARRSTPAWQVNVAQLYGRRDDFVTAMDLIERAYAESPKMVSGFARLGAIRMEKRDWQGAYSLMDRDRKSGRLNPIWELRMAVAAAHLGYWEAASAHVDSGYAADEKLKDGYASLGWHAYLLGKGAQYFRQHLEKDRHLGRSSMLGRHYSLLYATLEDSVSDVSPQVEKVYAQDSSQRNWFCTIGWLSVKLGRVEQGSKLMWNDHDVGRIDAHWLPSLAIALRLSGARSQASTVLEEILSKDAHESRFVIGFGSVPDALLTRLQLETFVRQGSTLKEITRCA